MLRARARVQVATIWFRPPVASQCCLHRPHCLKYAATQVVRSSFRSAWRVRLQGQHASGVTPFCTDGRRSVYTCGLDACLHTGCIEEMRRHACPGHALEQWKWLG